MTAFAHAGQGRPAVGVIINRTRLAATLLRRNTKQSRNSRRRAGRRGAQRAAVLDVRGPASLDAAQQDKNGQTTGHAWKNHHPSPSTHNYPVVSSILMPSTIVFMRVTGVRPLKLL